MAFFEWEVLSAQLVDVTSALNANGLTDHEVTSDRLQEVTNDCVANFAEHTLLQDVLQRIQSNLGLLVNVYPRRTDNEGWISPSEGQQAVALQLVERLNEKLKVIIARLTQVQKLRQEIASTEKKYAELSQEQQTLCNQVTALRNDHASLVGAVEALSDDARVQTMAEETELAAARVRGMSRVLEQLVCATGINAAESEEMKELLLSLDKTRQELRI